MNSNTARPRLSDPPSPAEQALAALWHDAGLSAQALNHARLPGDDPVVASSFAVATAAQAGLGAAGLAAAELWHLRTGRRQEVRVDRRDAVAESCCRFSVDGVAPVVWDKLSGLYPCGEAVGAPGWVRIHANFAHHRDGALRLLGCAPGTAVERTDVARALRAWAAPSFEEAAAGAGLAVAAVRDIADWDRHPQGLAVARQPVVRIESLDAPRRDAPMAAASAWLDIPHPERPLDGLRVLGLTRILAGPVAGRTLAAYGADVMLVNSPHLPNIDAIAETSRGKLSAHVDLQTAPGQAALRHLVGQSHVFLQGYRPGALAARGFAPADLAALRPGIVVAGLSAYGEGPWASRRGFDSLVQAASGLNVAEAAAFGSAEPRALPLQILDYAAGYLLAFGIQAALWRQATRGGSWHVQVSLAGVGRWLRGLGRVALVSHPPAFDATPWLVEQACGFGLLRAVPHAVRLSATPPGWRRPSMPPGTHPPTWPAGGVGLQAR